MERRARARIAATVAAVLVVCAVGSAAWPNDPVVGLGVLVRLDPVSGRTIWQGKDPISRSPSMKVLGDRIQVTSQDEVSSRTWSIVYDTETGMKIDEARSASWQNAPTVSITYSTQRRYECGDGRYLIRPGSADVQSSKGGRVWSVPAAIRYSTRTPCWVGEVLAVACDGNEERGGVVHGFRMGVDEPIWSFPLDTELGEESRRREVDLDAFAGRFFAHCAGRVFSFDPLSGRVVSKLDIRKIGLRFKTTHEAASTEADVWSDVPYARFIPCGSVMLLQFQEKLISFHTEGCRALWSASDTSPYRIGSSGDHLFVVGEPDFDGKKAVKPVAELAGK